MPVPSLQGGGTPIAAICAPHFGFLKMLVLKHHPPTRQQTMMEKGMITFKHNSPLTFSRFFANCWQPTIAQRSDATFRLIDTPLRMCRGRDM